LQILFVDKKTAGIFVSAIFKLFFCVFASFAFLRN